jgi:RNA polymerase sigma factor (sigma-70 family)
MPLDDARQPDAHDLIAELQRCGRAAVLAELRRGGHWLPPEDLDDLMQDIAVRALRLDIHRYDPARGTAFAAFMRKKIAWMTKTAVALTAKRLGHLVGGESAEQVCDPTPNPEEAAFAMEVRELVDDVLAADPRAHRVITESDFAGRTMVDLALEMGRHRAAPCRARKRALTKLRAALPHAGWQIGR